MAHPEDQATASTSTQEAPSKQALRNRRRRQQRKRRRSQQQGAQQQPAAKRQRQSSSSSSAENPAPTGGTDMGVPKPLMTLQLEGAGGRSGEITSLATQLYSVRYTVPTPHQALSTIHTALTSRTPPPLPLLTHSLSWLLDTYDDQKKSENQRKQAQLLASLSDSDLPWRFADQELRSFTHTARRTYGLFLDTALLDSVSHTVQGLAALHYKPGGASSGPSSLAPNTSPSPSSSPSPSPPSSPSSPTVLAKDTSSPSSSTPSAVLTKDASPRPAVLSESDGVVLVKDSQPSTSTPPGPSPPAAPTSTPTSTPQALRKGLSSSTPPLAQPGPSRAPLLQKEGTPISSPCLRDFLNSDSLFDDSDDKLLGHLASLADDPEVETDIPRAHSPVLEPSQHITFRGDKKDAWEIPTPPAGHLLIVGDSQLRFAGSDLPPGTTVAAYSGAKAEHLTRMFAKLQDDALDTVVIAIGTNHRSEPPARATSAIADAARNAALVAKRVFLAEIPSSTYHRRTIEPINDRIRGLRLDRVATLPIPVSKSAIEATRDRLHLSATTMTACLAGWVKAVRSRTK